MSKTLLLSSLGSLIILAPLLFYFLKTFKSQAENNLKESPTQVASILEESILSKVLNFSSTTWFLIKGSSIEKQGSNASCIMKSLAPIVTLEDFKSLISPQSIKALSYFLKKLFKDNNPFYLKVKTVSGQTLEIKAISSLNNQEFILLVRKIPSPSETPTEKKSFANFETIKQLVSNIPLPCWIKKKDGQLLHVNKAYEDISKTKNYQIIEQNLDVVEQGTDTASDMKEAREKNISYKAKTHTFLGSRKYYLEVLEGPLRTSLPFSESLYFGTAIDCSKESDLADQLKKYRKSFYDRLSDLSIGIGIFDENARLVFFNKAYAKLLSLGSDESLLKSRPSMDQLLDIMQLHQRLPYQPDFSKFKKEQLELFKTLRKPQEEILYLPDGSVTRVTMSPYSTGGLFYTMENITDTLELSEKYNTLSEVLKTTVDNLHECIAVVEDDGTFTLSNEMFHKFWKIRKNANLKGKPFIETLETFWINLLEKKDWDNHKNTLVACLSSREEAKETLVIENKEVTFSYTALPNGAHLFSYFFCVETI